MGKFLPTMLYRKRAMRWLNELYKQDKSYSTEYSIYKGKYRECKEEFQFKMKYGDGYGF